jgi:hypothetical protein
MPDAGRTRESCVQKKVHFCARKQRQGSRNNRWIQTVVATLEIGGCDGHSKEAVNTGAAALAGTTARCGAR